MNILKVSVIIPVYNTEKYLRECLNSVANQTLKDIEIICVDDGSTDNSLAILHEYETKDSRFKVLTQRNQFAGVARNNGMKVATGEYLSFLDSDDYFNPEMLETAYNRCIDKDADICIFGAKTIDERMAEIKILDGLINVNNLPKVDPFSYIDIPQYIFNIASPAPWNKLFRHTFVISKGLYFQQIKNANDVYFTMLALAKAKHVTTICDKYLLTYRQNSHGLQSTKETAPDAFFEAFLLLKCALNKLGYWPVIQQSFENLALDNCIYNLNSLKTYAAQKQIYNFLSTTGFDSLEITGHDAEYFYDKYSYNTYMDVCHLNYDEYIFNKLKNITNYNTDLLKTLKWNETQNKILNNEVSNLTSNYSLCKEQLLDDHCKYNTLFDENVSLKKTLVCLEHSRSYKLGRAITWLPRSIRDIIKKIKEHTINTLIIHLKNGYFLFPHNFHSFIWKFEEMYIKLLPCRYGLYKGTPRNTKIIVSLTSYNPRFNTISLCLKSILSQSIKPDKVIIYISDKSDKTLVSKYIMPFIKYGLRIEYVNDIGPHTKYYYVMKQYPDSIVITVDDDMIYSRYTIKSLLKSYYKYPHAVSARRVHRIIVDGDKLPLPYNSWAIDVSSCKEPSFNLFATGVGGVLYPPACMQNTPLFNVDLIKKNCLKQDDIWLKFMQLLSDIPVVWAPCLTRHPATIKSSQETALCITNVVENMNDIYINKLMNMYKTTFLKHIK